LLAFGGAAGLHVAAVAAELGIGRVVVPVAASVLSAWGMLNTDLRIELTRSQTQRSGIDIAALQASFAAMDREGRERLGWFDGEVTVRRSADMRYGEQVFEIAVPLDDMDWSAADPLPQIVERFHRRHEALYTYAMPEQESVLVNARVTVSGVLEELPQEPRLPAASPAAPIASRRIFLNTGWADAVVYDFDTLAPDQRIAGPAIIESAMTTVLLRPDDAATVTGHGWLNIAVPAGAEG
jgi:N-methylhydantoinase A